MTAIPRRLHISRAQPIGRQSAEAVEIVIVEPLPECGSLQEAEALHDLEAAALEGALRASLPQGTYARVAGAMLARLAGVYRGTMP